MKTFVTQSENLFSKILDYHELEWEYEPKTFVLETDEHGYTKKAFTPDFYVPKWDAYVEITMAKNLACARKNRRIEQARELYPETNIVLLNKKDMLKLIERYNFLFFDLTDCDPCAIVPIEPSGD